MAKKVIISPTSAKSPIEPGAIFNFSLPIKYIILAATGLIFYANTILNKYAFDDNMAIIRNSYVKMGLSGIPKILTHDSYQSYHINSGSSPSRQALSGGRYRPLSEIIFAIEQQFLGNSEIQPFFRHLVNILAYIACIVAIFYFLNEFLLKKISGGGDIAFLAAFLFDIHPLHTEVVANIKSLDEILSMLFIMFTFIYGLKYQNSKHIKYLIYGCSSFLLALLSKEYAATLVFFIPLLFYLVGDKKPLSTIKASLPYYLVFLIYLALRYNAVGFHSNPQSAIGNNPYLLATPLQKIATEWFVLGKYLGSLFFPYPLACDYSYNQIPYRNFPDIIVLFPILIYTVIFAWGIILLSKKSVLSFAVFFFLFTIFMISNFVLDIGATMGERLVFHASLGFVIILSFYLLKVFARAEKMIRRRRMIVLGVISVIGIACFGETVTRNAQWKNESTLFVHDVDVVPNSCLVNSNAGWAYLGFAKTETDSIKARADLELAHKYLLRALYFNPKNEASFLNLGVVYLHLGQPDSAWYCWDMVREILPNQPSLDSNFAMLSQYYFDKGVELGKNNKLEECINYMKKALIIDSTNANKWFNIGVAYYQVQQFDSAKYAWIKTLQYKPDYEDAKRGLEAMSEMKE